jgi:hypothetical protein
MSRAPGLRRVHALVLLLVLLVGGFGLPIIDGLCFHSAAIARMDRESHVATPDDSGRAHMLGCAVWSSPVASAGLPELGPPAIRTVAVFTERAVAPARVVSSQSAPTLALPRAPPSV